MFQDVVRTQVLQRELRGVGLWIRADSKVEQELGKGFVDVQRCLERVCHTVEREIPAVMGKEFVIGEGVEHRTGTAYCGLSGMRHEI